MTARPSLDGIIGRRLSSWLDLWDRRNVARSQKLMCCARRSRAVRRIFCGPLAAAQSSLARTLEEEIPRARDAKLSALAELEINVEAGDEPEKPRKAAGRRSASAQHLNVKAPASDPMRMKRRSQEERRQFLY